MKRLIVLVLILVGGIGGFLYVYLGIGASKVLVPPLVGKEITSATKLLNSVGLGVKVVGEEESTTFPPNYIVSQKPLPGLSVRKGTVVEVIISGKGDTVAVPDLVGRELSEANVFINEAGLTLGDVIKIRFLLAGEGKVIGQSISPTKRVKRGTKVDLLVSLGYEAKEGVVPDVVGLRLEDAKKAIQEKGFKVGRVSEKAEEGEDGIVLSQEPSPYSSLSFGGEVNLTVRKAIKEKPKETVSQGQSGVSVIPGETQTQVSQPKQEMERMELAVPKGARVIDFSFKVPPGKDERLVEIIQIDANGQHVIFKRKCKAGEIINLRIPAIGDNVIRVQLDGEFYAEDRYPWKKE